MKKNLVIDKPWQLLDSHGWKRYIVHINAEIEAFMLSLKDNLLLGTYGQRYFNKLFVL